MEPRRPDQDPSSFNEELEDILRTRRAEQEANKRQSGWHAMLVFATLVAVAVGAFKLSGRAPALEPEPTPVVVAITQERLDEAAASQFALLLAPNMDAANQELDVLRAAYPQCDFYAISENVATRGEALANAEGAVRRLRERLGEEGEDVLVSAQFARSPGGTIYWAALAADC